MPFVKGQSGNPAGRRKEDLNLKMLARAHTEDAIKTLAAALTSDNDRTRVAAAEVLLDRGWGKPAQFVENKHSGELVQRVINGEPLTSAAWAAKYEDSDATEARH